MFARKKTILLFITTFFLLPITLFSASSEQQDATPPYNNWAYYTIAKELGWKICDEAFCGGYYLDEPFTYPISVEKSNPIEITSNRGLISQSGNE